MNRLLFIVIIAVSFSCENVCDETVYGTNEDGSTYEECVVYNDYNVSQCDKKFVKVVVINKANLFTFDRFIDRIQERPIYELKIAENFDEFLGANINDDNISVEDTSQLLDSYIEAADTELDKDKLKMSMRELLTEAQALEVA